jgi:hypothetical protein
MQSTRRQVILYKGFDTFIFRYTQDQEDRLLGVLREYARKGHTSFDSCDVRLVSRAVAAQRAMAEARTLQSPTRLSPETDLSRLFTAVESTTRFPMDPRRQRWP